MARQLRPADNLLAPAVQEAINAAKTEPVDVGAVKLALTYARAIDDASPDEHSDTLANLGPKLLAALEQLHATPKSRTVGKGGTPSRAESRLAAIRAARPA